MKPGRAGSRLLKKTDTTFLAVGFGRTVCMIPWVSYFRNVGCDYLPVAQGMCYARVGISGNFWLISREYCMPAAHFVRTLESDWPRDKRRKVHWQWVMASVKNQKRYQSDTAVFTLVLRSNIIQKYRTPVAYKLMPVWTFSKYLNRRAFTLPCTVFPGAVLPGHAHIHDLWFDYGNVVPDVRNRSVQWVLAPA
jgi:hypothetical protein